MIKSFDTSQMTWTCQRDGSNNIVAAAILQAGTDDDPFAIGSSTGARGMLPPCAANPRHFFIPLRGDWHTHELMSHNGIHRWLFDQGQINVNALSTLTAETKIEQDFTVADEAEMLSLGAGLGVVVYREDVFRFYEVTALPSSIASNWTEVFDSLPKAFFYPKVATKTLVRLTKLVTDGGLDPQAVFAFPTSLNAALRILPPSELLALSRARLFFTTDDDSTISAFAGAVAADAAEEDEIAKDLKDRKAIVGT